MRVNPQPKEPNLDEMLHAWGLLRVPVAADEKSTTTVPARSHQETLPLLETCAALRGVMVLTGPPGAGKSTLVKSWMRTLDPKRHLPLLITQSSLSATGVLEIILSKLGERPRFKRSTNLLVLEKHLADMDPITLLLVLDDAQNYPAPALEEIRMLLGLGARQRAAFGLILLGDDYLLDSLRLSIQRALFSRISAAHKLQPLPREDIAPYLRWQVRRAGLDRDIFSQAATDLLAEGSEGNPRTLNLLAQAAWMAAARLGHQSIEAEHVHVALRQVPVASSKIGSAG